MASDKQDNPEDDFLSLDETEDVESGGEDFLDVEAVDSEQEFVDEEYTEDFEESGEDLSATRGDDDEFSDEDDERPGALKKMFAPVLILVAAGGIGAYLMLNAATPGGGDAPPLAPNAAYDAGAESQLPPETDMAQANLPDLPLEDPGLPQPAGTINELDGAAGSDPADMEFPEAFNEGAAEESPDAVAINAPPEGLTPDTLVGAEAVPAPVEPGTPDGMLGLPVSEEMPAAENAEPALENTDVTPATQQAVEITEPVAADTNVQSADTAEEPVSIDEAAPPQAEVAETVAAEPPPLPEAVTPPPPDPAPVQEQAAATPPAPAMPPPGPVPPGTAVPPSPDAQFPVVISSETAPPAGSVMPGIAAAGTAAQAPSFIDAEGPDVFYDSNLNVPTGPMAPNVGPRKIDPVMEPASTFKVIDPGSSANSIEAQLVGANRALKLGRYDSALEMFETLYGRNPRDPRILMGRAVALQQAGRTESAIRAYEELLAIDSRNSDALVNMLGLLRNQYPEVALRRLIDLQDKYPGNASIAAQIGVTQASLGHTEDALRYLGMASGLEPNNAQHLFNMAVIVDRAGDSAQAITYYERALEVDVVYGGGRSVPRDQIYDRLATLRR